MKKLPLSLGSLITGATLLAFTGAAEAQPTNVVCRGSLGAVTVDNLEVPEFASCVLTGTIVLGSIDVAPGARLTADAVTVRGNIQASEARSVIIRSSSVAGSVEIVQGGVARVLRTSVGGNIKVADQSGAVAIVGNRVGVGVAGDVEAQSNFGGTTISTNRIGGNLMCQDNLPAPTGSGNVVAGNKEEQCALL